MNLNAISEKFAVSRPAISQHVKILTECGLIQIRRKGRERFCEAKLDKLGEISEWIDQYSKFWNKQFDALDKFLQNKKSYENEK